MTLADLNIAQIATIIGFTDEDISLKLLEMGCLPGEKIVIEKIAPLGDPIAVRVLDYTLSMRKQEATTVLVRLNKN